MLNFYRLIMLSPFLPKVPKQKYETDTQVAGFYDTLMEEFKNEEGKIPFPSKPQVSSQTTTSKVNMANSIYLLLLM
jgi:hypothetical protein